MLKLRKCTLGELGSIYALFESDFDKKELLPRPGVYKAVIRGDMELLAAFDEETRVDLAYALVGCRGIYGCVWLKYLAVNPWYREKGLGAETMRLLHKRYADRQGIVAEITDFSDPEDGGETLRELRRFFNRFGYAEVDSDVRLGGVEDHVMVKPLRGAEALSPVIHRVLLDFYSRVLSPAALEKMVELRPFVQNGDGRAE